MKRYFLLTSVLLIAGCAPVNLQSFTEVKTSNEGITYKHTSEKIAKAPVLSFYGVSPVDETGCSLSGKVWNCFLEDIPARTELFFKTNGKPQGTYLSFYEDGNKFAIIKYAY